MPKEGAQLTGKQKNGERCPCYTQTGQAWLDGDRSPCLREARSGYLDLSNLALEWSH
jgi:hypothetical protein